MSTIRAQRYKKIIENRPFFTKKLSIIFLKEKGQRASPSSRFKGLRPVQGSTGFAQFKVQRAFGPVQGSLTKVRATRGSMTKFSDLKVQSDQRSMTRLKATSSFLLLPSYFFHLPSYFFHLTSFRTTPVPFNLEGAPPLSCILPPQEEENRSACRSYIMVSADHQRSGFFFALRQGEFNEGIVLALTC